MPGWVIFDRAIAIKKIIPALRLAFGCSLNESSYVVRAMRLERFEL